MPRFLGYIVSLSSFLNIFNSEVKITLNGNKKGSIIIPFNNIEDYKTLNTASTIEYFKYLANYYHNKACIYYIVDNASSKESRDYIINREVLIEQSV